MVQVPTAHSRCQPRLGGKNQSISLGWMVLCTSSSRSQPNSPSHACLESGMQYQVAREAVGSKSWETRCRGQDQQDKDNCTPLTYSALGLKVHMATRKSHPAKTSPHERKTAASRPSRLFDGRSCLTMPGLLKDLEVRKEVTPSTSQL